MSDAIADAIVGTLVARDGVGGYDNNITDALFAVARAINNVAEATQAHADATARVADAISGAGDEIGRNLLGIGQEIGWGLDPDDSRKSHL